jgi:hypothetical protein
MRLIFLFPFLLKLVYLRTLSNTEIKVKTYKQELVSKNEIDCNEICRDLAKLGALKLYLHSSDHETFLGKDEGKKKKREIISECSGNLDYKSNKVMDHHLACSNGNWKCDFRDDDINSKDRKGEHCYFLSTASKEKRKEQFKLAVELAAESRKHNDGDDEDDSRET